MISIFFFLALFINTFASWSFFFFFSYFRLHEIFYNLFIKSLPISVRWEACVASDSVLFRSKETPRNGIFARVLTLVPRSLLRNPRTPEKHLLRRLSGEHSLRRRLHLWLKTETTKHGMHYPHTGIIQSKQSIFIFHDLESHLLLDSASASVFKR